MVEEATGMKLNKPFTTGLLIMCGVSASASELPDTTLTLGEVSVTGIKQTLNIGSLPVASTVIGEDELEKLNIVTIR